MSTKNGRRVCVTVFTFSFSQEALEYLFLGFFFG